MFPFYKLSFFLRQYDPNRKIISIFKRELIIMNYYFFIASILFDKWNGNRAYNWQYFQVDLIEKNKKIMKNNIISAKTFLFNYYNLIEKNVSSKKKNTFR